MSNIIDNGDGTQSVRVAGAGLPTSLGQKTAANSTSVVLASDQSALSLSGTVEVAGDGFPIVTSFTPTTTLYTAGDYFGPNRTLTNAMRQVTGGSAGGTGYWAGFTIVDRNAVSSVRPALQVVLLDATPGSLTDNAAPGALPSDAVAQSIIGEYTVNAADWQTLGPSGFPYYVVDVDFAKLVKQTGAQDLYALMYVTNAPTYTGTPAPIYTHWKFARN